MSKIAPQIAPYLQQYNSLNLVSFGTFTYDSNAQSLTDGDDKNSKIGGVTFHYDPSVKTDDNFVSFVNKETGKMIPLAIADIDTFVNTGKQLLNISKPFLIEGLGSIVRSSTGTYTFTPGNFEPPKINTETVKERHITNEKAKNNELKYDSTYGNSLPKKKDFLKKILGGIVFAALLGSVGFVLYKYVFSKMMETNKGQNNTTVIKKADTSAIKNSTIQPKAIQADSLGRIDFKLIVRTTDSVGAYKRVGVFNNSKIDLIGYQSCAVEKDAVNNSYQVILIVKANPADTAAIRAKAKANYGTEGQAAFYKQ
jgi:hypothetical protein